MTKETLLPGNLGNTPMRFDVIFLFIYLTILKENGKWGRGKGGREKGELHFFFSSSP
jgi:hypothetical protein